MKICLELLNKDTLNLTRTETFNFSPVGDEATLYNEVCRYIEGNQMYSKDECYDWFIVEDSV